ncbi:MAG: hypothetical protein IPK98_19175 [Chloracidobacterium sp.]|nr:hypothetical protein [Chloracidobacterium sp.]
MDEIGPKHLAVVRLRNSMSFWTARSSSRSAAGHWGGGMFINAYDMARFGLLTTRSE